MRAHTPYICWCGLQRILKEWVRLRNIRLTHPSCTHKPADVLLMFLAHLVINMVGSTFFNINTGYAAHFIKSELLIGWCPALGWEVLFLLPSWISFLSGHLHGNSTRLNLFPATTTVYLSPSPQVHGRLPKMIPAQSLHPQCSFCLPETTLVSHAFILSSHFYLVSWVETSRCDCGSCLACFPLQPPPHHGQNCCPCSCISPTSCLRSQGPGCES